MKTTIKSFILAAVGLLSGSVFMASCSDYQDEINALEYRVTVLENLANEVNNNLASLQTLTKAMQDYDYITNVTTDSEGNVIITFSKYGAITIKNGKDGTQPPVSIMQDTDGKYYWALNGAFLLDANGNKIEVIRTTPMMRINDAGYWEYSVDGGVTWITTTFDVKGKDAETKILSIELDDSGNYVIITTSDGKKYTIPLKSKDNIVFVETLKINEEMGGSITMKLSSTQMMLHTTCTPANATDPNAILWMIVNWESADGITAFTVSPISIRGDGTVFASKPCKAKVRAVPRYGKDSSVYAEATIIVTND